ncbi:MAG: ribosomal protein L7/L12 [Quinella sp. 3Q1]|nr:ribosomal protein L7/L12 [Quinella sp. 3Q1]
MICGRAQNFGRVLLLFPEKVLDNLKRSNSDAEALKAKLEEVGATVEIK